MNRYFFGLIVLSVLCATVYELHVIQSLSTFDQSVAQEGGEDVVIPPADQAERSLPLSQQAHWLEAREAARAEHSARMERLLQAIEAGEEDEGPEITPEDRRAAQERFDRNQAAMQQKLAQRRAAMQAELPRIQAATEESLPGYAEATAKAFGLDDPSQE